MKTLQPSDLNEQAGRERAVAWALTITRNTPLAPKQYEQHLLQRFVAGELSLDEVIGRLEESEQSAA